MGLPSLKTRQFIAKLCYLNNMLRGAMHSSIPVPKSRIMYSRLRNFSDSMLLQPFARTNSYKFSFCPTSISFWNHLHMYLPGCATVLIYLHLRIICVLTSPDVSLCFNFLVSFLNFLCCGFPRICLWLLSVPCMQLSAKLLWKNINKCPRTIK